MKENEKIVNGYILAGGKSSRMGADKGLLLLHHKPVILHIIEQLRPVVNKIVIVTANPEYKVFGLEITKDLIKGIGPAGGIHAALSHSDTEKIFISGCDMPLVTSDIIKFIIRHSANTQITLPVHKGRTEPLFGVYSKECLPKWQELIDGGNIKLLEMIHYFDFKKLPVDENSRFNETLFTNMNTKTDFEKLNRHLHYGN